MKVSHLTAVPDNRTTLFAITTYLTTGVIYMCQGISFELWCSKEFSRLKGKTDHFYSLYHGTSATCGQGFAGCTLDKNTITLNHLQPHLEDAFQFAYANKKSKALKDSTSIPLTQDENWSEDGYHITTNKN